KNMPALERQIRDTLHKTLQDMQRYNRGTPQTESEKLFFLTDLIKLFNQDICQTTRGEEQLFGDEVRLFTKIRKEFHTWGVILLECAAKAKKNVPSRVWKYEDQYRGREFPGFSNYRTFEDIIKEQIRELEEPAIEILNNVMRLVEDKFIDLSTKNFANFHNLGRAAKVKIEDIREKQAAEAERHIRAQFKMERIVYCQDDLYIGYLNTVKAENAPIVSAGRDLQFPAPKEPSTLHFPGIFYQFSILHFFSPIMQGASKRLCNQIPLIILSTVLHDFGENLQTSMLQLLQDKEKLNFLLDEDSEAAKTRNYLSQRVDRLTKACQYLREFSLL
ncbi:MX protein, partial [Panurus biarmicus]|nr:MX protein [Panurus biarmicus]